MNKSEKQTEKHEKYRSPFVTRWAGEKMLSIWSDDHKFKLWRRLWIALAKSQKELGLDISDEALKQLEANKDNLDLEAAAKYEQQLRHDVMAHVSVFGDQCPDARPIIHLGATSCFVGDNSELIMIRESLRAIIPPLTRVCRNLADFAMNNRALPCLAYTQ